MFLLVFFHSSIEELTLSAEKQIFAGLLCNINC